MCWPYTHGGSLAALPEVGLLGKGCWHIVRVPRNLYLTPLPGVRSMLLFLAMTYGRCYKQCHFHVVMVSSPTPGQGLSVSAFKGCSLPLKLSWSEVPGPRVLLSNYVARVISRGPGILSCLSPFLGCLSGSSVLAKSVFLVLKSLFILAPASAGRIGVFHAVSFRGSHSGGWSVVSFSFVLGFVAKTQDPSSLAPQFAGFTVPAQPNARQSQWETVISCAGGRVFPGPLCCASSAMWAVPFCRRVLHEGVIEDHWLRMPLSRVCRLSVTDRSVCVPWARRTRAVAPSLLWEVLCCHPGGRASVWHSHTSLRCC